MPTNFQIFLREIRERQARNENENENLNLDRTIVDLNEESESTIREREHIEESISEHIDNENVNPDPTIVDLSENIRRALENLQPDDELIWNAPAGFNRGNPEPWFHGQGVRTSRVSMPEATLHSGGPDALRRPIQERTSGDDLARYSQRHFNKILQECPECKFVRPDSINKEDWKTMTPLEKEYLIRPKFITIPFKRGLTEIVDLLELLNGLGSYICGGYARYCCSPNENPGQPEDIDIFTFNEEIYLRTRKAIENFGLDLIDENEIAIEYQRFGSLPYNIQIIKPFDNGIVNTTGDIKIALANFDFTITRAAILSNSKILVDKDLLEDEKEKILRFRTLSNNNDPHRVLKYLRKGYKIHAQEWAKVLVLSDYFIDLSIPPLKNS